MQKLGWVVLVALACGCGDDGKPTDADAGAAKPDGGDGDGPGCGIAVGIYPGYTGAIVWSEADLSACDEACPGFDQDCVNENCPGATEFLTCLDNEIYGCQTSPGQDCRREYVDLQCCIHACSDAPTQTQFDKCTTDNCTAADQTTEECYLSDTASPGFVECREAAYEACLGTPVAPTCTAEDAAKANPWKGYAAEPSWTKTWTTDELDACIADCEGEPAPLVCFNEKCAEGRAYRQCVYEEAAACSTPTGAECRASWEARFCCVRTKCASAATPAQLQACYDDVCKPENDAFDACNVVSENGSCKAPAEAGCVPEDPDAGTPHGDGGTSAPKARALKVEDLPAAAILPAFSRQAFEPSRLQRRALQPQPSVRLLTAPFQSLLRSRAERALRP